MGGRADDFGPDGAGSTADEAFAAWMGSTPFPIPRSKYRPLGQIGDRFIYFYEVDDRVKVVIVISPRFGELVGGAPFTIEEMRTCDPSEYGAAVDLGPARRVWAQGETGEIVTDISGPAHCGWESARMLHLTTADGSLNRQYLRDPLGVFSDVPALLDTHAADVELPDDAVFSGYRTTNGLELWFTPEDRAAYVVADESLHLIASQSAAGRRYSSARGQRSTPYPRPSPRSPSKVIRVAR